MKTKSSTRKKISDRPLYLSAGETAFLDRQADWWDKFHRLTKARQRSVLINLGALTPEGNVPAYPMDHVPLGPKE